MKKRVFAAMLIAACMAAMPTAIYAEEATDAAEETTEAKKEAGDAVQISDNLYDFQFKIDDTFYQLPMTFDDFTETGWTLSSSTDPEESISTSSYAITTFNNGKDSLSADMINLGINAIPVSQCLVGGISIEGTGFGIDLTAKTVELPGGIVMGQSTLDDIIAAYGNPSDTYESDLYTKVSYEQDSYEKVELYVYKEDGTLKEVDMRNYVAPEGFDPGSVSTETPEIVTAYEAPAQLGDDFMEPIVEYCGDLYKLPAPVTAFEANGWVLQDVEEGAYVAGSDIDFIKMSKNNQTVNFTIKNMTGDAVTVENCFVRSLEVGSYDNEAITLRLSGDITLGANRGDLMTLADEKGYLYDEEGDYLNVYRDKDTMYDNSITFWFNKDEDAEAAAAITYENCDLD